MTRHILVRLALAACAIPTLTLAACSDGAKLPADFEVIGKSELAGTTIYTARDTGTGCEILVTDRGVLTRNERGADGVTVKQRCVLTGDETPVTTVTTNPAGGQASFAPMLPPKTAATREDVVQAAQNALQTQIPPASAPTIPPPRGSTRPRTAETEDGVESQLK